MHGLREESSGEFEHEGDNKADFYVCQRQSLKLLSEMLLDRSYMHIMLRYIDSDEFLKVHMQFLRSTSKTIQFEANLEAAASKVCVRARAGLRVCLCE